MPTGTVTYQIVDKYFDCGTVKELIDCTTSSIYYVDDLLLSGGTPITTGTTFVGNFNFSAGTTGLTAVTYVRELQGSSTITFNGIVNQLVDCSAYSPTPSPTVTSTITPTVTPTVTPTPTSSLPLNILYVFSACTGSNRVVVQTQPISGVTTTGKTINYSGTCWSYVGAFTAPYSSPPGYIRTDYTGNYFGTPSTVYNSCALTGGGTAITLYTPYSATTLNDGVIMYTNVYLTTAFAPGRWFQRSGKIYYNDGYDGISFICNVGGGC